jgi:sRNA-binding protein
MSSLSASQEQLTDSLRQLSSNWESAKGVWNDAAREDFEKNYWTEFESSTSASIGKLQDLMVTLAQAEREIP